MRATEDWIQGDAHVHLHPGFDRDRLLGCAAARAEYWGGPLLLLLGECAGEDRFRELALRAGEAEEAAGPTTRGARSLLRTGEVESLAFGGPTLEKAAGFLVAGRQIVSAEGIEVLALALDPDHPLAATRDHQEPARLLVARILEAEALAVLPWGLGKWLGRRGREVGRIAEDAGFRTHPFFALGDSRHRARPWPRPRLLRQAARVLPGSDPMPLAGGERAVATYGFRIAAPLDRTRPAASLRAALRSAARIEPLGGPASFLDILREQVAHRRARRGAAGDASRDAA